MVDKTPNPPFGTIIAPLINIVSSRLIPQPISPQKSQNMFIILIAFVSYWVSEILVSVADLVHFRMK